MSKVQFTLNGKEVSVDIEEASGKTLNEYIRHNTRFTGTKVSCAQGGCGVCTVAVARPSQPPKSMPSCITPLATMHGAAVITSEGLTSHDNTPHPVAERLAKFNGTQCGFCTPGMVMQLYSTLNSQDGGKAVKESELEQCINGNVCRCTGYRPIIDCAKSFASDTTIKNWIDPSCEVGPYDAARDPIVAFPAEAPLAGSRWVRPASLQAAIDAITKGATPLAGGTAAGVYPELGVVGSNKAFVDISALQELKRVTVDAGFVEIGAAVTWNEFAKQLTPANLSKLASKDMANPAALTELCDRCSSIAGAQVRNAGTIGGNIAITRNKGFLSDWVPVLAALGAKVKYVNKGGQTSMDLLEFVQQQDAFAGLIVGVSLPLPASEVVFKAFRVAKRSRNAHALVNAGFSAALSDGNVKQVKIVLGAVDPKPLRLSNLEQALGEVTAKSVQADPSAVVAGLCEKVRLDLVPLKCNFGRDQTDHIVSGFAVKFIASLFKDSVPKEWGSASYCLHDMPRHTSSKQTFPPVQDLGGDMHKPMPKTTALDQAMGVSKFVDDYARPTGTLIAALVVCPEANVKVVHELDTMVGSARAVLGDSFHALLTAADLGVNELDCFGAGFGDMADMLGKFNENHTQEKQLLLLPADTASHYAGQSVALLLAEGDQPRLVERAALEVSKGLKLERQGPAVIGNLSESPEVTDAQVFTKGNAGAVPKLVEQAKKGTGKEKHVTGRFAKASQSHFYMEGQSLLVVPDEGGITVHAACQAPEAVQRGIMFTTGLQQSKIALKFKRVGGGFGGKVMTPMVLSGLASQAALKLNLPVRLVLPRETDMGMVGGRQEVEGTWSVSVNSSTGKISAIDYELWWAHGAFGDMQRLTPLMAGNAMDMVYGIPNWRVTSHMAKQNVANRTATRAPGHFEAVLLIESLLDGVAAELGLPGHVVREVNFFQGSRNTSGLGGGPAPQSCLEGYSNLTLWKEMKAKVDFENTYKDIQEFNKQNAWKKRGFSMTCARYGMMVAPGQQAKLCIFKDGSLQIAVAGCEIGQGLHTKVGQGVTTAFARSLGAGPPMDSIRFLETSTEQNANGGMTGGSSTSEGAMYASIECAEKLAAQLKPAVKAARKKTADKKNKHPTNGVWFDIVEAYFGAKMGPLPIPQLATATAQHLPPIADMSYETYGVASTELELDVLTGESRVLKSHLMFDIGKSYNPMVDIGQVEGCFIMGMGQNTHEEMHYDKTTGKVLTDNTWTYKPPIACDVPETFNIDLVDMEHNRLSPCCCMGIVKCLSSILSCCAFPWKPSPITKVYKSAKAVGEPPLLLAASVQSAHSAAIVAARGSALPDNYLPIPAKPFNVLPLLSSARPGKASESLETASTATPQSSVA